MVRRDSPIAQSLLSLLTLLLSKICLCQLIDDLILKSSCTHSRLKNLEFKEFRSLTLVGTHFVKNGFERVLHGTTCQHLRSIVTGRLLAVTSIQTIYKSSFWQNNRIASLWVAEHLRYIEITHTTIWHKEGSILKCICLMYLDVIFLCIETTEGEQ